MQPALDDPATVATLAAYRGGALRWVLGGGIAVAVAVLAGIAAVAIARDTGEPVPLVGLVVLTLLLASLVAIGAGVGSLLRARRWGAALARTPWQPGVLRTAGAAVLSFEPSGPDQPDAVPLRLQSTTAWRARLVQRLDGADVSAAPVDGGEWVFTADGLGTLIGVRERRGRR